MPDYRQHGQRHHPNPQGRSTTQQDFDPEIDKIRGEILPFQSSGLRNLSAEKLVEIASRMGEILRGRDLKTTQIRRFLDGVRKIDSLSKRGKDFNAESVILLKPKLAYAAGRDMWKLKPLMHVLEPAITAGSRGYEDFKKLLALIEGIVAYHKFYGGQD